MTLSLSTGGAAEHGFTDLLDDGLQHWRNFRAEVANPAWKVENGVLSLSGPGGDLISKEQYEDFDLRLEWSLPHKGNSGIFIGVSEGAQQIWHEALEMQILHNDGWPDISDAHVAGAIYELKNSKREWAKAPGEWNEVRIVKKEGKVTFTFNGHKVGTLDLSSKAFAQQVEQTKFKQYPKFGKHLRGHIGIQDHGDSGGLKLRKIRIKEI